jgi:hypothetical protein
LAIVLVGAFVVRELKKKRFGNLAFIHLGFWGIILWLFWDLAIFRDPLYFIHAPVGTVGGVRGADLAAPNLLTTVGDLASRVDVLYITAVIVLALALIPQRNKLLVGAIIGLYALSVPIQAPVYGVTPPFNTPDRVWNVELEDLAYLNPKLCCPAMGYSLVRDVRAEYQQAGQLIHGSVLISTRLGLVGGDILSILGRVDVTAIIDEHDPDFRSVSRAPWNYADYVLLSKEVRALRPDYLTRLGETYGSHFIALYYSDRDWRGRFREHYQPIFEIDRFILYERIAPST